MYIVIVGAGEVGSYLARILIAERHDVGVIESDERLARQLDGSLDALVVHGSGVNRDSLISAGIERADLFIAVTQVDEVNLVACMTAAKLGKPPRTVARVREAEYLLGKGNLSADEFGLNMLMSPEHAVAEQIARQLSFEGMGDIRPMAGGRLVLLELPLSSDSPFVHEPLAELRETLPQPSLVAAIHGPDGIRIPRGDDTLRPEDRADIITVHDNIEEFLILSGNPWHHVRHVLIIGCGTIGLHLAQKLESQRLYPTIIENDRERALHVARKLPKSIVLYGDGTDPDFLREQLEESADAVVVLIGDDDPAILTGVFAKHLGAKKVLVRADQLAFAPLAHKLGVDALVSPRRALANAILRFVRRGRVESTYMLGDNLAEVIEMQIPSPPENEELVCTPLRDLNFPKGTLLGAVVRDDEVSIASGETILRPGDRLLVVATSEAIPKVERLIR